MDRRPRRVAERAGCPPTVVDGLGRWRTSGRPASGRRPAPDAWGIRGRRPRPRAALNAELRARLAASSAATLSSQLRKRGYDDVEHRRGACDHAGRHLVGAARTLRFVPYRQDLFAAHGGGYNAQKRAFDALRRGEVLVIEARGERGAGTLGDILALRAQVRGAAGIVTDGAARDVAAVAALEIPVFAAGAHPAVLGRGTCRGRPTSPSPAAGRPCGPGDVIVGDDDGALVIPPALVREVVADGDRPGARGGVHRRAGRRRRLGRRAVPDERRVEGAVRGMAAMTAARPQLHASKSQRAYDWIRERIATATTARGTGWCSPPSPPSSASAWCRCARRSAMLEAEGLVTFERNVGAHVAHGRRGGVRAHDAEPGSSRAPPPRCPPRTRRPTTSRGRGRSTTP